jgi:UDP-3-O-[3-hydroxymyristoyl] glucosamine N-acyltransferase
MSETLGGIASFLNVELRGDPSRVVDGIAPLDTATPSEISFLANLKYAEHASSTRAAGVLCRPEDAPRLPAGCAALVSAKPYRDYARITARSFDRRPRAEPGIHATAVVHATAVLASTASVGAYAVLGPGVRLGEGSAVHALAYVGPSCVIGADCVIHPGAVLYDGCRLGDRVVVHSGAVLGADGFGFAPDPPSGYVKVPQIGWVEIEDDVEIQANACVDRGTLGPTCIRRGAKIDNLVQIAHNVEVGEHTVLAAQAGISGSTKIGKWVTFGGQSASGGHLKVGDQAVITGQAGLGKDVPPKAMVSGSPAQATLVHHRGLAELNRLSELRKTVKALETRLRELEARVPKP